MRLRRGVLAVGLLFLTMSGVQGAMASDIAERAGELHTISPTETPSPTTEPTAVPTDESTVEPTATTVPDGELIPVHVAVWLCEGAKCAEPAEIVSGASIGVIDTASGQQVAGCVTGGDPAGCGVGVPVNSDWEFAWDDSTIPAGYVFDSIAVVTGGGWDGDAYIIQFVPAPVEPQVETVHVGVMLCDSADCVADGELLAGVGVASVDTTSNTQVDNCETGGDPAVCEIDVPLYSPWTLTWDSTVIPDGYHYIGELAVVEGGAYPVVYLIRLVPDAVPTVTPAETVTPVATVTPDPTKAPVTGLPKTGAGEDVAGNGAVVAAMLAASAIGLAVFGAVATRRRSA